MHAAHTHTAQLHLKAIIGLSARRHAEDEGIDYHYPVKQSDGTLRRACVFPMTQQNEGPLSTSRCDVRLLLCTPGHS